MTPDEIKAARERAQFFVRTGQVAKSIELHGETLESLASDVEALADEVERLRQGLSDIWEMCDPVLAEKEFGIEWNNQKKQLDAIADRVEHELGPGWKGPDWMGPSS